MESSHLKLLKFPDAKSISYEQAFAIIEANINDNETACDSQIEILTALFEYFSQFEEDFICLGISAKLLDLLAVVEYFWANLEEEKEKSPENGA